MDTHEVWQENKRWILGAALGFVVFWVGSTVIDGLYSTTTSRSRISKARRSLANDDLYTSSALRDARKERDALEASRARLVEAMVFEPLPEFVLEGVGDPDLHFDQVSRRVKRDIVRRAGGLGVEIAEKDLEWNSPVGDEIAPTLVALCALDQAASRLMDSHEQVREWDPEALGLVGIDQFRIGAPGRTESRGRRSRRKGQDDVVREESVRFRFRADEATVVQFLESCASARPPLTLSSDFKMTVGRAPGDPLVVSGTLNAVSLP